MPEISGLRLPDDLRPQDGRFGSGPTRVDPLGVAALADTGITYLGRSHRSTTVRSVVGDIRSALSDLYELPDGYEVLLGNGGATAFWDAAVHRLISERSQHCVFGEFSGKFAAAAGGAPFLREPVIVSSDPGSHPFPIPDDGVDAYALTQNETSTGVAMPIQRPPGQGGSLVLVDATSAAGAFTVDPAEFDAYYFSPQKAFGSDGGLWLALLSPAATDRIARIASSGRWAPPSIDLGIALENSRSNQTYNTPALATLFLLRFQIQRLVSGGGLLAAEAHCRAGSRIIYDWAEASGFAEPFVKDPADRSHTTVTVDLDPDVPADPLLDVLAQNGIFDVGSYRKLGRNQIRVGVFPNVSHADLERLTGAIDWLVSHR